MTELPIVVVGASAGGIEALRQLVAGLPHDLPAAVCVVLHLEAASPSALPSILSRGGPLPAHHPADGEALEAGRIYVAPPDHHLMVDGDHVAVKRGPKESRFRPSVDALFRSAAYTHAPRVIGVVLSGVLDDGTSGLWTIKRLGGVAVVQSLADAAFDAMPRHALEEVDVDHEVTAAEMGPLLARLVREGAWAAREDRMNDEVRDQLRKRLKLELNIAAHGPDDPDSVRQLGPYSAFTCPECHGVLVQFEEGGRLRFRCHTGHAYTQASLLAELSEAIEDKLYQSQRAMEEGILLLRQLGARGVGLAAERVTSLRERVQEVQERADLIHRLTLDGTWAPTDTVAD